MTFQPPDIDVDVDPEAPEADAVEQHTDADPSEVAPPRMSSDPEAPEADAIEQSLSAPLAEDDYT